jgi:hypothetical protein
MRDESERIMKESATPSPKAASRQHPRGAVEPPASEVTHRTGGKDPPVPATTRPDALAKGLGEHLRSRTVSVPAGLAAEFM